MVRAVALATIGVLVHSAQSLSSMVSLTLKDYEGEYFFGGNRNAGSILVTPAGKTKSGARYNAPYSDLQDFPSIVRQEDLKDALWVWLPGQNQYNGEGWYHHDTIYQVEVKSATSLIGYTGDMQRMQQGQVSRNQGKAAMTIAKQGNALVMNLGGGFGHESWVHYLPENVN